MMSKPEKRVGLTTFVLQNEGFYFMTDTCEELFAKKPDVDGLLVLDYNRILRR